MTRTTIQVLSGQIDHQSGLTAPGQVMKRCLFNKTGFKVGKSILFNAKIPFNFSHSFTRNMSVSNQLVPKINFMLFIAAVHLTFVFNQISSFTA